MPHRPLRIALLAMLATCAGNPPADAQSAPVPLPAVNSPMVQVGQPPDGNGAPGIVYSDPLLDSLPERKRVEFFPTSLLWEPKLADKREPRVSVVLNDVDSFFSNRTTDPSIGMTLGVFRLRPERFPNIEWQVDLFAVSHLRFSRGDESIAQDYRYGLPITFRTGNLIGKVGYEHTSTQLGDELFESGRRGRATFERDEAVAALGYLWENQLRVYGQAAYAVYRSIPGEPDRWRYDVGFDWYQRVSTGLRGQPFAAVNAAFDPAVDYHVTMTYQVGWMWKKVDQRLGQFRVYAEFFDGRSVYGQLFRNREQYAGLGISMDY